MPGPFRKHWLVVALVALVALACGFAGGAYAGYRYTMSFAWIEAVKYDGQIGAEAFRLYKSGDPGEARHALAAYLRYLETVAPFSDGWRPGQHPWLDSKGLAFDKMLTAGRLALAEDRATGTNAAESLWQAAASYAREAEQSDTSRAGIESIIKRLDAAAHPAPRR
jgi:hypothetical protein